MKENSNKILFASSFTLPLNAGSGRNTYNFGKFLAGKGYEVTLLSLNRKGKHLNKETYDNFKIIRLLYFNHNYFIKVLSLIIILPGYLYHVVKNDVVFIYGGNIIAFEFLILASKFFGKQVVFRSTMYGEDDIETLVNRKWIGKLMRFTLNQISLYFSINSAFTNSFERIFKSQEKIFESVHGVNTTMFYPVGKEKKTKLRQKLHLPEELFIIVSVGYLVERKGFRGIFEALEQLDIPFLYVVIGDYHVPEEHYLKNFNQEMIGLFQYGKNLLKDKIIFKGNKSNIDEYLKASDIFILNSIKEGFPPNSVMESMACGLPSIVREIEGVDGYFTKRNNNILVTSGESNEILACIKRLLSDPKLRENIGKNAGQVIRDQASFEVIWCRLKTKLKIHDD